MTAGAAATHAPPPIVLVPPTVLMFDAELKQMDAKATDSSGAFTFWVTNVCATNVLVLGVVSSCGCMVGRLPSQPWVLAPGAAGPIHVTVDLQGRWGVLMKGVEIHTSGGVKALVVRVNLPAAPTPPGKSLQTPVNTAREHT
jgi:hypothetical protein